MTARDGSRGDGITEAAAPVVIAYARFRECQDRRRAITAAFSQPDRPPTSDVYVVHVEAATASLRPLKRNPC
jgi:hypothetical protein